MIISIYSHLKMYLRAESSIVARVSICAPLQFAISPMETICAVAQEVTAIVLVVTATAAV